MFYLLGILGTKEYRKPEWVTHMEEIQQALRGKNRARRLDVTDCMPNNAECSYSSDSLDDRALKDESSQRDSSTVISEFSSTRTLMNISDIKSPFDEGKATSQECLLSRRYSDSTGTEENFTVKYSLQINAPCEEHTPIISDLIMQKKKVQDKNVEKCNSAVEEISSSVIDTSILNAQNTRIKHQEHRQNMIKVLNTSEELPMVSYGSIEYRKHFAEFPPTRHERQIQEYFQSNVKGTASQSRSKSPFYLSPIEEKSEKRMSNQNNFDTKIYKMVPEELVLKPVYHYNKKYHTYPKSRIPVSKYSRERRYENYVMDPRMFPLEPREIDLESFQQLHTADSQEELQEFLLLESQCSGNLGLAGNVFASEVSCDGYRTEDERGTMSGRILFNTNYRGLLSANNRA